jgi:hypothetical protein
MIPSPEKGIDGLKPHFYSIGIVRMPHSLSMAACTICREKKLADGHITEKKCNELMPENAVSRVYTIVHICIRT